MKSLKAQLVAAIAMTMIAALTIGSSTYAWYTMSSGASVTGMDIKVNAGNSLLVALGSTKGTAPEDSGYKSEVDFGMTSSTALGPCSTYDGKTFYTAKAASASNYAASGEYTSTTSSYIEKLLWLKSGKDCSATIESITVSGLPTGISPDGVGKPGNSMRIGIYVPAIEGESADLFRVFAIDASSAGTTVASSNKDGYGYNGSARTKFEDATFVAMQSAAGDKNEKWIPLKTNTGREMYVYFWFEGEDMSCYTNNINTTGMKITFNFMSNATS